MLTSALTRSSVHPTLHEQASVGWVAACSHSSASQQQVQLGGSSHAMPAAAAGVSWAATPRRAGARGARARATMPSLAAAPTTQLHMPPVCSAT